MTDTAVPQGPAGSSCLVADDHPAVLRAVCEYLEEEGFEIVARAADGAEALDKLTRMQPPLAVLDISMPKMTGIEVAREAANPARPANRRRLQRIRWGRTASKVGYPALRVACEGRMTTHLQRFARPS
ncbi:MAG: response regulator [Actinobacteria bacterium]|uniref:Unannotated protein n=1 Tax=freshwater metagenome TaxID=449393 RepID=A0A6J6Q5B0_9ZZZZ|nr:response regulator [Actinomycetota bacterium]